MAASLAVDRASFAIRAAHPDDAPALTAIAYAAKAHWGYSRDWLAEWQPELTIMNTIMKRGAVRVCEDAAGMIVGFAAIGLTTARWTLQHLWVWPEAMGRGVGKIPAPLPGAPDRVLPRLWLDDSAE